MAFDASALSGSTKIDDLVTAFPIAREVLTAFGLACAGCSVSKTETLAQGAAAHGLEIPAILAALEEALRSGKVPAIPERDRRAHRPAPPAASGPSAKIGAVVPVMSGKGGVGKSFVTALLAVGLRRRNLRVGIIDADITGPSIPRFFGLRTPLDVVPDPATAGAAKPRGLFVPAKTRSAIEVVSSNLLTDEEDSAMIWRGPIVSGVIRQFFDQTVWSDLDVLLVDLPPGTSDAPLTVLQALPVTGVVLVTMPQRLATMIVRKAARLIKQLERPVLGVVENMAYYETPDTHARYSVFGPSYAHEVALLSDAPLLAQLPIEADWMERAEAGTIETIDDARCDALAESVAAAIAARPKPRVEISLL